MIYELAQRLRSRGYNTSRNELVYSALCGIIVAIFVIGGIGLGFSVGIPFDIEAALVMSAVGSGIGIFISIVMIMALDAEYSNSRCLGLPAAFGFVIGSAVIVGLFALLPTISLLAIPIILLTVFIGELFFLADSREPTHEDNLFAFTVERKIVAFITAFVGLLAVVGLLQGGRGFLDWAIANWVAVTFFFGIVGFVVVILLAFYAYIKVNSLKYRRNGGTPQPPQFVQQPREERRRVEPDFEYVDERIFPSSIRVKRPYKRRKKKKFGQIRPYHIYTPKQIRDARNLIRRGVDKHKVSVITGVNEGSLGNQTWLEDRYKWASKTKKRK